MRRIFILHADHEQNASTSTVRLAGSSGANPFACIAAGIACLWGPAHGGANEAALNMLREIGTPERHPRIYRPRQGQERPVPADGLRPPRLQELRPAREGDAEDRRGGAEGAQHLRPGARRRARSSSRSRSSDDYFIEKKLYPERRFLFGRDPLRDRLPDRHVHRPVRARPHRRLGRAVERDDLRPRPEDRPPAPALHRRDPARLCAGRRARRARLAARSA